MAQNKTPFLLNLNPAEVDEPRISNDEFLDSLDMIGVWLRVLPAFDSLERYSSPESTSAQRLAALSNIYVQLGAQLEDQAVALVAFSAWVKARKLALADLFSRIFMTRGAATKAGSAIEAAQVKLLAGGSETVRVDQRAFFREVAAMGTPRSSSSSSATSGARFLAPDCCPRSTSRYGGDSLQSFGGSRAHITKRDKHRCSPRRTTSSSMARSSQSRIL